MTSAEKWSDRKIEDIVANLLRFGVLLAAAVVLCGALLYLMRHGAEPADYRKFQGEPADLRTLPGIFRGAANWQGRGIIQLGLLLLIATPVARGVRGLWLRCRARPDVCSVHTDRARRPVVQPDRQFLNRMREVAR